MVALIKLDKAGNLSYDFYMKQFKKWTKNRFFIAMLLAVTLLVALYYYSAYGQAQEKFNSLKEALPTASPSY